MAASPDRSGKTEPGLQTLRHLFLEKIIKVAVKKILVPLVLMLFTLTAFGEPQSVQDSGSVIRKIEIYGNKTTRPEILKLFFAFDTGFQLDSSLLQITRERLLRTQLYNKVDIFPFNREDGVHVFVVLEEAVRFTPGYSGEYSTTMYGKKKFWWSLKLEGTFSNFRGRMEELSTSVSFWDARSLGVSWYKPFLPSPYFISSGAKVATSPDIMLHEDNLDVYYRFTLGRRIGSKSRIAISTAPTYRRKISEDTSGFRDTTRIYEAYSMLSLVNDFRSSSFDPQKGWVLYSELRSNHLYHSKNNPYIQFSSDLRWYLPLFFDDKLALRCALTLRNANAGENNRLLYGAEGQIRGYGRKALGWGLGRDIVANSAILLSAKYYKPIWKSPPLPIPYLQPFLGIDEITYRIDASLIADYAKLHHGPLDVLTFKGPVQSGVGLGTGFRAVVPVLRQSVCLDVVYGRRTALPASYEKIPWYIIMAGNYYWLPATHAYLDLFF